MALNAFCVSPDNQRTGHCDPDTHTRQGTSLERLTCQDNSFQWQAPAAWGHRWRARVPVRTDSTSETRPVELGDDRIPMWTQGGCLLTTC